MKHVKIHAIKNKSAIVFVYQTIYVLLLHYILAKIHQKIPINMINKKFQKILTYIFLEPKFQILLEIF